MSSLAELILPWEFSPLVLAVCAGALLLYGLGVARGAPTTFWKTAGFVGGIGLFYIVTQTAFDYYSQYLFFAHRGQHLVLHHLAPFLVALSAPAPVFAAALRRHRTGGGIRMWQRIRGPFQATYRLVQTPWVAGVLFVGLIAFWLIPAIHFDAMLSRRLYWVMNWSMALDGLLFWLLIFAREPGGLTPHLPLGRRLLLLIAIIPPQLFIGATLVFGDRALFDIYDVCGRAIAIDPLEDQQLGGLITWVPPAMMSMAGVLILLARHLQSGTNGRSRT